MLTFLKFIKNTFLNNQSYFYNSEACTEKTISKLVNKRLCCLFEINSLLVNLKSFEIHCGIYDDLQMGLTGTLISGCNWTILSGTHDKSPEHGHWNL